MERFKPGLKPAGFGSIPALILIGVVIVLVGAAFIFFKNPKTIGPPAGNTPSKTEASLPEWKTYTNAEAGFSLKYPDSVLLNAETKGATQPVLLVSAQKLTDIQQDQPSFTAPVDPSKQKADLTKGGENTVKIGSLYGSLGMPLSQFEVCSVILTRSVTFYPGNYQVVISLFGPEKAIMDSMPEFFTVDPKNCGDQKVWNQANPKDFAKTLANKQGAGMGQQWYDTFDAIVKTITLQAQASTVSATASPIPADLSVYKNSKYGFEISYPKPYKVLDGQDDLAGYPHGAALIYNGGQAYDVVVEVWDSQADYENNFGAMISDVTVKQGNGKFITLQNATHDPENKKIIDSFKLLQ